MHSTRLTAPSAHGVARHLSLAAWLRELVAKRDLLYMLAWREIRVKYKQSIMGFLWAILMPALIVCAGVVVKVAIARISNTPVRMEALATVAVKSVPWAFVVASIRFATVSLIGNSSLVTKIYMPREIFPIAAIASQSVDLAVSSVVLAVILVFMGVGLSVHLLWVPVLVALLILLVTGLGIFLSAASLFFRDVKYLVEVFLTFAIFFTPVFFEANLFGEWGTLLLLNPIAPLLEALAVTVVGHQSPDLGWLTYSAVVTGVVLFGALVMFKRVEPYFAEAI
jgi:lipopolysaccharide transport system permease protein